MSVESHSCLNCGETIYDDGDGEYIYRKEDDTFICSAKCEEELIRKGE